MQPYWSLLTKTTFRVHLQICPSYGRVRGWVPDYNILLGIVDMGTCTFLVHGYRFKRSKSWVRIPMVIRNIHRHICTYRCTYIHNINEPTTPPLELHPCHCSDYSSHLWQQRSFDESCSDVSIMVRSLWIGTSCTGCPVPSDVSCLVQRPTISVGAPRIGPETLFWELL